MSMVHAGNAILATCFKMEDAKIIVVNVRKLMLIQGCVGRVEWDLSLLAIFVLGSRAK